MSNLPDTEALHLIRSLIDQNRSLADSAEKLLRLTQDRISKDQQERKAQRDRDTLAGGYSGEQTEYDLMYAKAINAITNLATYHDEQAEDAATHDDATSRNIHDKVANWNRHLAHALTLLRNGHYRVVLGDL